VRVLLDACVPRRLRNQLPKHEVRTAQQMGWGNLDDGPLLDAMGNNFDALVTVDKGYETTKYHRAPLRGGRSPGQDKQAR